MKSKIINVQISDLMRGALLYKYGGFYLDHDAWSLTDLRGIRNVIVMDNVTTKPTASCEATSREESYVLNQGTIQFEQGSPFMLLYMKLMNEKYRSGLSWGDLGPPLMHEAAATFLGYHQSKPSTPVTTPNLTILPSFKLRLFPSHAVPPPSLVINLKTDVNGSYFDEYIRCSHVLHLTGSEFKSFKVTGNPRRDIYSYMAPKICPITYAAHFTLLNSFCFCKYNVVF
ncbi:uncharacterized protein LOC142337087 isoform X2 [Convolutriloba macropyga]